MNNDELFRNNLANLTAWFKVVDFNNPFTLEDFSYESGVPESGVGGHCWKCITVNQCYFKNEPNKKPEEFDYSTMFIPKFAQGIYHPNCECKKLGYAAPLPEEIKIIMGKKFTDLYNRKIGLFYGWGYNDNDKTQFEKTYLDLVKKEYCNSNYYVREHTNIGCNINIVINFPGKNEKLGKFYKIKTGFIVFPNKKIRCITFFGGRAK